MSSPPADSIAPLKVRKRPDARAILGDRYKEVVSEIPVPPQPLRNARDYTNDRLKLGLEYADATIRINGSNLSPIDRRTISAYKEACIQLLILNERDYVDIKGLEDVRFKLLAIIRTLEESRAHMACLITESKDRKGRHLSSVFESNLTLSDPKRRVKREASTELEGGTERAKRQERDWDKLQNMVNYGHFMKALYKDTWGELLPPAYPIVDPLLDGLESAPEPASESESEPGNEYDRY